MGLQIRLANPMDLPEIREIYAYARMKMKETGNPNQWGDDRPKEELLVEDIQKERLYLVTEGENICGSFAFILGEDPTYLVIEQGAWLNDEPYGVIHRIASNGTARGVLATILSYCEGQCGNIRIDTHADNKIMQHLLEKNEYQKCGIIYVDNGTPRIAYHKVLGKDGEEK